MPTRRTTELDHEAIGRGLRERIADYAVPEQFIVLDELPRNAAGKTDRHELRQRPGRRKPDRVERHDLGESVEVTVVVQDGGAGFLRCGSEEVVDDRESMRAG